MSLKSSLQKNIVKNSFKGIKIIAFIGGFSLLFTQFIIARELSTTTKVPTTYNVSELSYLVNRQIPTGYVKANYKAIYSIGTLSKTPSSKDLSLQEAAEIAAQEIFKLSGEQLDNQTLQMSYYPQTSKASSSWTAEVDITPSYGISATIDGSTGELTFIRRAGGHDIDEEFDIDAPSTNKLIDERLATGTNQITSQLDASYAKTQNLIAQKGYISDPIESITYVYTSCDAYAIVSHTFDIITTSNKHYRISLSQDLTQLRDYVILDK